jgi:ketosteroid isomerase-like protein
LSRAETAVRKLTQDWMLACNGKQLDDLVDLYAVDAIVLRPNVPPVRGTAAIREFFFGVLDAGLGEVDMEPLRVETFGDVASEAGRCKMLVPFTMGKRREERGKYLLTLARQAGDWKILADCWSSDLSLGVNVDSAPPKSNVPTPNPAFKPPRKGP